MTESSVENMANVEKKATHTLPVHVCIVYGGAMQTSSSAPGVPTTIVW
jgi:hypothetical protein